MGVGTGCNPSVVIQIARFTRRVIALSSLVFALLSGSAVLAADSGYREVQRLDLTQSLRTKAAWTAVVYESIAFKRALAAGPLGADQGDVFDRPARICFVGGVARSKECLETRTTDADSANSYVEQSLRELSTISLTPGRGGIRGILLRTISYADSGGEVGTRIWRYVPETDSFSLVGAYSGSEVSEVEALHNNSGFSFLVTSDYIWAKGEGHFDAHHFRINVLHYLPEGRFEPVLDYVTDAKYPITQGDVIIAHAIKGELGTIRAKVRAAHPEWDRGSKGAHLWMEDPQLPAGHKGQTGAPGGHSP